MSKFDANVRARTDWKELDETVKEEWRNKAKEGKPLEFYIPKSEPKEKILSGYNLFTKEHPSRGDFKEVAVAWNALSEEEKEQWRTRVYDM